MKKRTPKIIIADITQYVYDYILYNKMPLTVTFMKGFTKLLREIEDETNKTA